MSIEALAMLGVDYTKVKVLGVQDKPWLCDRTKIDDDNWRQMKENSGIFDQPPDEKKLKSSETDVFPSIDFGRDMHHCQNGESISKAGDGEPDKRMKIKLREWAQAVTSYVILLDAAFKRPSPGVRWRIFTAEVSISFDRVGSKDKSFAMRRCFYNVCECSIGIL